MGRRSSHHDPALERGQEEVLGTTSRDESDPALSAEPVQLGYTLLWSTAGSCLEEQKLATMPVNQPTA